MLSLTQLQKWVEAGEGDSFSESILRGLGLLSRDGKILNAAVVLFGRAERLLPEYPQCLLRVVRFVGHDKTEFSDNKRFVGIAASEDVARDGRCIGK